MLLHYHSKNRRLMDMLSIHIWLKLKRRELFVLCSVRVKCYHTMWKLPNIGYHWSEMVSTRKGLFTDCFLFCLNFCFCFLLFLVFLLMSYNNFFNVMKIIFRMEKAPFYFKQHVFSKFALLKENIQIEK